MYEKHLLLKHYVEVILWPQTLQSDYKVSGKISLDKLLSLCIKTNISMFKNNEFCRDAFKLLWNK